MRLVLHGDTSHAFDSEGREWVRANKGCHAGEWLRLATRDQLREWEALRGDVEFCWELVQGGWKRLSDVFDGGAAAA